MLLVPGFIIFSFISVTHSARILAIFATPMYSHQMAPQPLLLELQARGHELVVFTTNPLGKKAPSNNYREIDLSYLYKFVLKYNWSNAASKNNLKNKFEIMAVADDMAKHIYAMEETKDLIKNDHFDLVLVEWSAHASNVAFSEHFNCPLIGFRSLGLRVEAHDVLANPVTPSYISVAFMEYSEGFCGRLRNFLFVVISRLMYKYIFLPRAEEIAKINFPNNKLPLKELERNVSIMFTYTNPILMGVRPLVPANVEIGGLHLQNKTKKLPKDIQTYLDNSKQGVILFSLGSLVSSEMISQEKLSILAETFSELPYNIILKLENNPFDKKVSNVLCLDWFPQESILGHQNVRLFISHGGILSIWESIFNHVPLIGIPFHTDQFYNIHRIVELGIGLHIDFQTITKTILKDTINEMINNPSYKRKTKEVATIIQDQPFTSMEKALWWIEYVLRHRGAPHFKSKAVGMPWYIYYSLDVLGFLLLILLVICYIIYRIIKFILSIICKNNRKRKLQ